MLPTKPFTIAMRYGPGFLSHWKYLVWSVHGLKHAGSAPGPETIFGPAKAEVAAKSAAPAANGSTNLLINIGVTPVYSAAF
ncbi:MAG: hypothetical protein WCK15_25425 [Pirellula sp.]